MSSQLPLWRQSWNPCERDKEAEEMLNTFDEVVEDEVFNRVEVGWTVVNCVVLNATNVVESK